MAFCIVKGKMMDHFVLLVIESLDAWADKKGIDISAELASIESKINGFYESNEVRVLNDKSRSKVGQIDEEVKICKSNNALDTAKVIGSVVKDSKHTFNSNSSNVVKSEKIKPFWIDFSVRAKLIKGISYCKFCKVKRLECREHTLFNGDKVLVCKDCRRVRHKQHLLRNNQYLKKEDALDYSVSGSYGSGKLSR